MTPEEAARAAAQEMEERHTGWAAYGDDGPGSQIAYMIAEALRVYADLLKQEGS